MNKQKIYEICTKENNITKMLELIQSEIRLSEKSIPKCVNIMRDIMKKNIIKLQQLPKNKEELRYLVRQLDKMCVIHVIEIIAKKYPDLQISRKIQVSKEQMRRDREVFGDRKNHVQDRSYIRSKREYDDDSFNDVEPSGMGTHGTDIYSGYASAFGDHLITTNTQMSRQPSNNRHRGSDSQFEQRFQRLVNDRNSDIGMPERPPSPDFTLDGSGEKVRRKKLERRMVEENQPSGMIFNNGFGTNDMDDNLLDDPYASLLSQGAPSQNIGQINPFMGMGNPLMSISSTNAIMDQPGFNNMNNNFSNEVSAKSAQLSNDLEKKIAERDMIDRELGWSQPTSQNFGQMNNMNSMQIPNMIGNMQMGNMPMSSLIGNMQISNMGI
jgi:hypothetical protein